MKLLFLLSYFVFLTFSCEQQSADRNEPSQTKPEFKVLVFSKTAGFYHKSIPAGQQAIVQLGDKHGFQADTTKDASFFKEAKLKGYDAVVFLNTTMDVLNEQQQIAFENYIREGNGFVGIHSAADTEYEWPWYGKLVGAYFLNHPEIQEAVTRVTDRSHLSTDMLPAEWRRTDEWYNYKDINPDIHVLCTLDESTYEGGKNGEDHPIAWYHEYDGGRAWYTGHGHRIETYSDPLFLDHVLGGIYYAAGVDK